MNLELLFSIRQFLYLWVVVMTLACIPPVLKNGIYKRGLRIPTLGVLISIIIHGLTAYQVILANNVYGPTSIEFEVARAILTIPWLLMALSTAHLAYMLYTKNNQ